MARLVTFVAVVALLGVVSPAKADGLTPGERETFALAIVDGRSDIPVANATVTLDLPSGTWRSIPSSAEGVVPLPGDAFGHVGHIVQEGFVPSTLHVGSEWSLIPNDDHYPLDYHRDIVVGDGSGYSFRMEANSTLVVAPDATLYERDRRFRGAIDEAREKLETRLTRWNIRVEVEPGAKPMDPLRRNRVVVPFYEDPGDPIWREPGHQEGGGLTFWSLDGCGYVVGARIVFYDLMVAFYGDYLIDAVLHELRHVVGLVGHSERDDRPLIDYTPMQEEAFRLLGLRPPGTRYPDDSTRAFCSSAGASATTSAFEKGDEMKTVKHGFPLRPPKP